MSKRRHHSPRTTPKKHSLLHPPSWSWLTLVLGGIVLTVLLMRQSNPSFLSFFLKPLSINIIQNGEGDCGTNYHWDDVKGCVRNTSSTSTTATKKPNVATPKPATPKPATVVRTSEADCGRSGGTWNPTSKTCTPKKVSTPIPTSKPNSTCSMYGFDDCVGVPGCKLSGSRCVSSGKASTPIPTPKSTSRGAPTPKTGASSTPKSSSGSSPSGSCEGGFAGVRIPAGQYAATGHGGTYNESTGVFTVSNSPGSPQRQCTQCQSDGTWANSTACDVQYKKDKSSVVLPPEPGYEYTQGRKTPTSAGETNYDRSVRDTCYGGGAIFTTGAHNGSLVCFDGSWVSETEFDGEMGKTCNPTTEQYDATSNKCVAKKVSSPSPNSTPRPQPSINPCGNGFTYRNGYCDDNYPGDRSDMMHSADAAACAAQDLPYDTNTGLCQAQTSGRPRTCSPGPVSNSGTNTAYRYCEVDSSGHVTSEKYISCDPQTGTYNATTGTCTPKAPPIRTSPPTAGSTPPQPTTSQSSPGSATSTKISGGNKCGGTNSDSSCASNSCEYVMKPGATTADWYCMASSNNHPSSSQTNDGKVLKANSSSCSNASECGSSYCADVRFNLLGQINSSNTCQDNPFLLSSNSNTALGNISNRPVGSATPRAAATQLPTARPVPSKTSTPTKKPTTSSVNSHTTLSGPPPGLTSNGTGTCVRVGNSYCDGESMYELYTWYADQPDAWWYGGDDEFTPADFLTLMLSYESRGGGDELLDAVAVASTNQLWGTAPGGREAYCTDQASCDAGIFNFVGSYMQSAGMRYNNLVTTGKPQAVSDGASDIKPIFDNGTADALANQVVYSQSPKAIDLNAPTDWGAPTSAAGNDPDVVGLSRAVDSGNVGTTDPCGLYYAGGGDVVYSFNQKAAWDSGRCR